MNSDKSDSEKIQTSVYFPKKIYESLAQWAEEDQRPISNMVSLIVARAVERREKLMKEREK